MGCRYYNGTLLKQADGTVKELNNDDIAGTRRYIQSHQMRIFFDQMDLRKAERKKQQSPAPERHPRATSTRESPPSSTGNPLEELWSNVESNDCRCHPCWALLITSSAANWYNAKLMRNNSRLIVVVNFYVLSARDYWAATVIDIMESSLLHVHNYYTIM